MTYHAHVVDGGSIGLPTELAREFGINEGDRLVIARDPDGALRLKTYAQVVKEVQAKFRAMLPEGYTGRLVDELIADRRAEAAQADAELEEWLKTARPR